MHITKSRVGSTSVPLPFEGAYQPRGQQVHPGADFMEIGVGAGPWMGEAFLPRKCLSTIYYNPAGLGSMQYPVLSMMHQEMALDSRFENVSFCYPVYNGYLGISNSVFWVPPFEKVDINGNSAGKVTYMNGAFTAAYGYDMEFMYLGGGINLSTRKLIPSL
jgi:hypothetical protein